MDTTLTDFTPELLIPRQLVNNNVKKRRNRRKRIMPRKIKRLLNEDPEARRIRLEKDRERNFRLRLNETPEAREARLAKDRIRQRLKRKSLKGQKYEEYLERNRKSAAEIRRKQSPEKRQVIRERQRLYKLQKRLNEETKTKEIRRRRDGIDKAAKKRDEDEKKRICIERGCISTARKKRNENPEDTAIHLKIARGHINGSKTDKTNTKEKRRAKPDYTTEAEQNIDIGKEKAQSEQGLSIIYDESAINVLEDITSQTQLAMSTLLSGRTKIHAD